MLLRTVKGVGPLNADIMLIGEAPGENEERLAYPFVGWSGEFLQSMIRGAGLDWYSLRIDNVVQHRPPNNNFNVFYNKSQPSQELTTWWEDLSYRIIEARPKVVIACGDQALKAITGHTGVTQWRGSVIPHTFIANGASHSCLVVPIVHPAFSRRCYNATSSKQKQVRQPWFQLTVHDLKRVARIVCEGWHPQPREELIWPSYGEVLEFLRQCESRPPDHPLTIDIETLRPHDRGFIACLGITDSPNYAMCIPFIAKYNGESKFTLEEEVEVWEAIDRALTSHPVIAQNAPYEVAWLEREVGMDLTSHIWLDTMVLHSLVHPELSHSLGFLASMYTDLAYFKDQGKGKGKHDPTQWWRYNCQDVYATHEIAPKLIEEAKSVGLWGYYHTRRHPLLQWTMRQHKQGLLVDKERVEQVMSKLLEDICSTQEDLDAALVAEGLDVINPASATQVKALLTELGFKVADTQEATLLEYADDSLLIRTILAQRQGRSFYSKFRKAVSPDGILRTGLSLHVTETTRLASRKDHFGTGTNLQNMSPKARPLIRARAGRVLIELDLSQAEARCVAWYVGDEGLKAPFKENLDVHTHRAHMGTGIPYEELMARIEAGDKEAKATRQGYKRCVHAVNYDVGVRTLRKSLLSDGLPMSEGDVKRLMARIHRTYPGIHKYQQGVQSELLRSRTLVTALGGRRYFFSKLDQNTFRRAYAYLPQRTVAEVTNDAIVRLEATSYFQAGLATVLLQVHDSLLIECREDIWEEVSWLAKNLLEKPFVIYPFVGEPEELSIPVDGKMGTHWGELKKFKWEELNQIL